DVVLAGEWLPGRGPAFGQLHVAVPDVQHDGLGRVGERQRVTVGPLVVRVGIPGYLGREVGQLGLYYLLVLVQRGPRGADHGDDQAGVVQGVDPAAVQRAVRGGAGGHGLAVGPVGRRGAGRGHEHVLDADAVRP